MLRLTVKTQRTVPGARGPIMEIGCEPMCIQCGVKRPRFHEFCSKNCAVDFALSQSGMQVQCIACGNWTEDSMRTRETDSGEEDDREFCPRCCYDNDAEFRARVADAKRYRRERKARSMR